MARKNEEKLIIETVPLAQCVKDDELDICHSPLVRWSTIGYITLIKIKVLKNGDLKIKYRKKWKEAMVETAVVPNTLMANRMRKEEGPSVTLVDPVPFDVEIRTDPINIWGKADDSSDASHLSLGPPIPNLVNSDFDRAIMEEAMAGNARSSGQTGMTRKVRSPLMDLLSNRRGNLN